MCCKNENETIIMLKKELGHYNKNRRMQKSGNNSMQHEGKNEERRRDDYKEKR